VARLLHEGQVVGEASLTYAGEQSTYAGRLALQAAGTLVLEVLAMDAANANFGHVRQQVTVEP